MAKSGSITTSYWTSSDSGQTRGYTLSWTATQSIANNQSTISWTLSTSGSYKYTVAERTLYVVLAGKVLVNKTDRVMRGAGTVASGSFTVGHDSSGNCSISGSIQAAVYTSAVNCTASGSWSLDTIPRKANITGADSVTDEENPYFTFSNPGEFDMYAELEVNPNNTHLFKRDVPNTGSFTFELTEEERNTLRKYLPNSTSGTLRYLLYSNGGGWVSYVDKTLTLSEDIIPTATVTVTDIAEHFDKYGKYVQGQSKLKIDISAEGVYGSTIKSYKTTFDGKTYTGSSMQTDAIVGKDTLEIETVVTDSRNRTVTVKKNIDVYEYKRPKILSLKSKRCQQYNINVAGDKYLGVLFESEVTSLDSQNKVKYEIACKKTTEDSYTVITLDEYENQHSVQGNVIFEADKDAYDIILRITDDFVTVEKKITGPSISVLLSKLRYNLGLAFGKLAELEGVFDIGFKTRFSGGIHQDILEDGKDLNELVTPNTYLIDSTVSYSNAPEDNVNAVITVSGNETFFRQRFEVVSKTQPRVYERMWDAEGYGEWVCIIK